VQVQLEIERKLREKLAPVVLEVVNESSMHSVPKGSETHFKVTVVSLAFEGIPLVERHRLIYAALGEEMKRGLHALSITSRTPAEWERNGAVPASPPCLGGSKAG
jgi:BolA family transcriptional regulator, general stress-responsive regulator